MRLTSEKILDIRNALRSLIPAAAIAGMARFLHPLRMLSYHHPPHGGRCASFHEVTESCRQRQAASG
jgi:hypothetical protein